MNRLFWAGKRVFITGHTGFKGSWLSTWLKDCGAILMGYSLAPDTSPNLYGLAQVEDGMQSVIADIRDLEKLTKSMSSFAPEIVIHMAAQPLVRTSYYNPVETYSTNVMGTVNLLEAVRRTETVKVVINVTTDKCYDNKEWVWGYREDEPMGGFDPYSSSKGCSELVTAAYRNSFFNSTNSVKVASARAGNVIGGGDWAKDRLIPDILKSLEKNRPIIIRNPISTRPWQHVLEPLSGYLKLAERLYLEGDFYTGAWNFGPEDQDVASVGDVADILVELWGDAVWEQDTSAHPHEARLLKLDISKSKTHLNWHPKWRLKDSLDNIVIWHKNWLRGDCAKELCLQEIIKFTKKLGVNNEPI